MTEATTTEAVEDALCRIAEAAERIAESLEMLTGQDGETIGVASLIESLATSLVADDGLTTITEVLRDK